jgi:predicted transcriptional regulator
MTAESLRSQDPDQLMAAVERVGALLTESGIPRMAGRVFAYALAEDSDRYTAADFADALQISPAAVSGAVRFLTAARLLFRERVPGQRAEVYRVYDDDVWSTIMAARLPVLRQWQEAMRDAAGMVGVDSRGGRRLLESEDFFDFMHAETAATLQRWQEHRRRTGDA